MRRLFIIRKDLRLTSGKLSAMVRHAPNAMHWGNWFQLIFAFAMAVLAIVLVVEGVKTFVAQLKSKKANA